MTVPTCLILGFLLLAVGTYAVDYSQLAWLEPLRGALRTRLFADAKATSDLLSTIAGSIITVISITISLLLLAVQQAAGSLTHQVFDQFLRRRTNQVYFGFFIGLAVYALVTLATVDAPFQRVSAVRQVAKSFGHGVDERHDQTCGMLAGGRRRSALRDRLSAQ